MYIFYRKCAMISAHYGLSEVFDNLVISLCKFTTFLNSAEVGDGVTLLLRLMMKCVTQEMRCV